MRSTIPTQASNIRQLSGIDQIRSLLTACALPVSDISDASAIQFYGIGNDEKLVAVIGLERFSDVGLLRSLAVDDAYRGHGMAQRLVAHVEQAAALQNVHSLYLLTTTAAQFFRNLGFTPVSRAEAPLAIRASAQFSCICPSSSTILWKPVQ